MSSLFLIFNHILTPDQNADARHTLRIDHVIPLPPDLQDIWSAVPPEGPLPLDKLERVVAWLSIQGAPGDFVLVQGEFGATVYLVEACFERDLIPVYSTTQRVYENHFCPDGTVENIHRFRHVQFRRYLQWRSP